MLIRLKKKFTVSGLLVPVFLAGCMSAQPVKQSAIDRKILVNIQHAVFEVVVPKQNKDSLTYEKELPLHLLPYAIRTDKFFSIGTAFATGKNRFLSAAHVIPVNKRSQFNTFYLRDRQGNTYEIDKVFKYSNHHDFIEFSVKGGMNVKKPFILSSQYQMNKEVFAVGNAYGEGIIARNGVLTSQTPEDENGEWKWLRFSAAASPGNSGGPLLDSDGKVLGIVVRKSENENLNYALPISVVTGFKKLTALEHHRYTYRLINTERTKRFNYDYTTGLPQKYKDLQKDFLGHRDEFVKKMHNQFIAGFENNMFPHGKGSTKLLFSSADRVFPGLICENKNREWATYYPKKIKTEELDNNGFIQVGVMGRVLFIRTENPDDVKLLDMMENPKDHLDQILKAIPLQRTIMGDDTRIVSFGKPRSTSTYVDKNRRKWIVSTWLTEYNDGKIIMFTLPIPGGTFSMMVHIATDSDYILDMEYLTDFIHLSYTGTFQEWEEFLGLKKYIPQVFNDQEFSYRTNVEASYRSKRFNFKYKNELQKISDNSILGLNFGYFTEQGTVKWDVTEIIVMEDKDRETGFFVSKFRKPVKGLTDDYFSDWKRLVDEEYPFNSTPYFSESKTVINTVYKPKTANNNYLYTLGFIYEGKHDDSIMKEKIKMTRSCVKVR